MSLYTDRKKEAKRKNSDNDGDEDETTVQQNSDEEGDESSIINLLAGSISRIVGYLEAQT